ncbi:MAG: hypothetical protein M1812_008070 [Candelaria pacifica]|nr:MAG: hypothetical protein M1812_008070 [Candelaria pacifica]
METAQKQKALLADEENDPGKIIPAPVVTTKKAMPIRYLIRWMDTNKEICRRVLAEADIVISTLNNCDTMEVDFKHLAVIIKEAAQTLEPDCLIREENKAHKPQPMKCPRGKRVEM